MFEPEATILPDIDLLDRPLVDIVRFNPAAGTYPISRVPNDVAETWTVPPGFACPVDHMTRRPFEGPLRYLLSLHDRGKYNAQTNRTYAFALKPALEAIVIEGRPYDYIDDDVATTVVNSLLGARSRLGGPLSGATIECYIQALSRCADYTNSIGMTSISIDTDAHVARGWRVASMLNDDGTRIDTSPLRSHMIRPLREETADKIESRLLMDPRRWHPDGISSRPGVAFANGYRNGLRLIENLGIMVDQVLRFTITDPNEEFRFPILRTKGAPYRDLLVFGQDILRWQGYAANERKACVDAARAIHGSNWDEPRELLVNGLTSGEHVGAAAQPSTIQRDFRLVQERLDMFKDIKVPNGKGGFRTIRLFWHCYHDLRHSYAHRMYRVAKLRSDHFADDPISFVQLRLGHADRFTTARIYLWPDKRKIAAIGDHAVAGHRALINA